MSVYRNRDISTACRTSFPASPISSFRPLSTTAVLKVPIHEQPTSNGNPGSGLGYTPRQIWRRASPRTRFWLVAGLGVAVVAESTFWVTFGPQVLENIRGGKKE